MAALYVFDASALVEMKWNFPAEWNVQLLDFFAKMAREGRWISVGQVLAELAEQEDALSSWARGHRSVFREADEPTQKVVREILRRFPRLVAADKEIPDADPFVIAEALLRTRRASDDLFATRIELAVVSQERVKTDRPTIPSVCEYYDLPHMNLFGFLKAEDINLTV